MRSKPTFVEQARRRQILQTTAELLAERGFQAASLAAIAERAGISKGVVSYHFADGKDDLLRQLVRQVIADAGAAMTARMAAAGPDPLAMLRAYVRANVAYLVEHRVEMAALVAVLTGMPRAADGSGEYDELGRQAVTDLAKLLAAGQRARAFRGFDTTIVARSIRASIDAVTELVRQGEVIDAGRYAKQLLTLIEGGVLR